MLFYFSIIIKLQSYKLTLDIVQRFFHSSVSNANVTQNIDGRLGVCSPRVAGGYRFDPRSVKPKTKYQIHTLFVLALNLRFINRLYNFLTVTE